MIFTVVEESGKILSILDVPDLSVAELNLSDGQRLIEGEYDGRTQYFIGNDATPFPEKPGDWSEFDYNLGAWTDPRDQAELMKSLREQRDKLLRESDWTQLPDNNLTEAQVIAWRNYRQELRDFPENCEDISNPVFPEPPI